MLPTASSFLITSLSGWGGGGCTWPGGDAQGGEGGCTCILCIPPGYAPVHRYPNRKGRIRIRNPVHDTGKLCTNFYVLRVHAHPALTVLYSHSFYCHFSSSFKSLSESRSKNCWNASLYLILQHILLIFFTVSQNGRVV